MEKIKPTGLEERSGLLGKDLYSYDRYKFYDLIQINLCLPETKLSYKDPNV